ncbi:hypothetical protein GUJ93_ZPchr0002g25457 [Zizania palustris]|uniref:Ysc84 actin-binding domain-containing protein n=1 Tax=Zizania palustris TaxID=103762 RepID=A0A8J5VSA0_ZIZPA|nr:hypothetical protein GUJ93_ZPchr0002g25457 [Zizania palustris]
MVTYKVGTGLVIARRADGSWSPPSAISTCSIGYGAQVGGELADFIIVLRNTDAINTFSGKAHLSVGAGSARPTAGDLVSVLTVLLWVVLSMDPWLDPPAAAALYKILSEMFDKPEKQSSLALGGKMGFPKNSQAVVIFDGPVEDTEKLVILL